MSFLDEIINLYKCPVTLSFFDIPIAAPDGHTYEKSVILKIYDEKKIFESPLTKEKFHIDINNLKPNIVIKNMVTILLEKKIITQDDIYDKTDDLIYDLKKLYSYNNASFMIKLEEIFKTNNYSTKLIDYLNELNILNNQMSYDTKLRPIHFICRYSTPEIIKYTIDKGVNLEVSTIDNWRPIHYICSYSTPEMIKYITDKGVDLEVSNKNNWRPIHFICRYSTPGMIKYIIDKNVNLEVSTDKNWRPIHVICHYSTFELIKYIINKGVNLNGTVICNDNKEYSLIELIKLNNLLDSTQKNELILSINN